MEGDEVGCRRGEEELATDRDRAVDELIDLRTGGATGVRIVVDTVLRTGVLSGLPGVPRSLAGVPSSLEGLRTALAGVPASLIGVPATLRGPPSTICSFASGVDIPSDVSSAARSSSTDRAARRRATVCPSSLANREYSARARARVAARQASSCTGYALKSASRVAR